MKTFHTETVSLFTLILLCVLFQATTCAAETSYSTFVQGMVGAARFSEDDLTFLEASDDGTLNDNDLSEMPFLGLAFQQPFGGETTQYGLDGSILFGWRSRDTRVVGGGGNIAVSLDSSLWLIDLSAGLFVNHMPNDRWRLYAAAGPVLLFGDYSADTDEENLTTAEVTTTSDNDTEFGVGGYARAGVDFLFAPNAYIGLCVRGLKTSLEFDQAPDASSDLSGAQAFMTFSRNF